MIRTLNGLAGLLLLTGLLLSAAGPLAAAPPEGARDEVAAEPFADLLCAPLSEALRELQHRGLRVIYSSDLVRPEMQVRRLPSASSLNGVLEQLLAPHGLSVRPGPGEALLVVPGTGFVPPAAPAVHEEEPERTDTLPAWVDAGELGTTLVEASYPGAPAVALTAATRYLVVRLAPELEITEEVAFALKNRIVDARSHAPHLQVGLEAPPAILDALAGHGLARYVDGYLFTHQPHVPAVDATGPPRWRAGGDHQKVLARLLEASDRGIELVIFGDVDLQPDHESFLRHIRVTQSGALRTPPSVSGIPQEQVRFFLEPRRRVYYLAVEAPTDRPSYIAFTLLRGMTARPVHPTPADFEFHSFAGSSELTLFGGHRFYLFELEADDPDARSVALDIADSPLVDPYEVVVRNQVFQDRQYEQFESLDVMEYIHTTPQRAGSDHVTWTHRIIQRKGHLTDYHHLGLAINGVPYPEKKLRKGRIFRSEALVQLQPLEIELDDTYEYRYLGSELLDGHPTWKIGFRPRAEGSFLSGVVWIDRVTHAHRRLRTVQGGLDGGLVQREVTADFGWIADDGQCFWDWRERHGFFVTNYLGFQSSFTTRVERQDFDYNRPDIEEVVRQAYESDILIHVETPPDGHRWLVKGDERRARAEAATHSAPTATAGYALASYDGSEPPPAAPAATSSTAEEGFGQRVLAGLHAFATPTRLSVGGFGGGESSELFPGIEYLHDDFLRRGYQLYLGFFLEDALVGLSNPDLFDSGWSLTGRFARPYSDDPSHEVVFTPAPDGSSERRDLGVDFLQQELTVVAGRPIARSFAFTGAYTLRDMSYRRREGTDDAFVLPRDTLEHVGTLALTFTRPSYLLQLGVEQGWRARAEPWGLDASQAPQDTFGQVFLNAGWFRRLGESRSVSVTGALAEGWDMDRFSRSRLGRAGARVAGFSDSRFDRAATLNLGYNFNLFRKVPVGLRLDGGRLWFDTPGLEPRDLVGVRVRFLLNGPFKTDIRITVSHGLYSSLEGEAGETRHGVSLLRRI